MLIVRGVNVFPTQIEELIFRSDMLTAHYQIVLTREGRMDEMTVQVEARPEAWGAGVENLGAELAHHVKALIGITATVVVVAPGTIERSLGKARRVIDKRALGGSR
jgi:phenylacetate-CoA ligase